MTSDQKYILRCIELARNGIGWVAPNPMVGAVLVHNGIIIGEGWHQRIGEAHAEPNCIQQAVKNGFEELISQSTLYVSLEPCAHYGRTPPCSDLLIKHRIPKVVIGVRDPFPDVNGKGIEKLKEAGIEVVVGVMEEECRDLNKRFFTFHQQHRPYIVLKWAQTADRFIAHSAIPVNGHQANGNRLLISNSFSNRLVHKWRSEEAAILVGTNTALADNPELTVRNWPGKSPVRLVVDMDLKLPSTLQLFNQKEKTIVFNNRKHEEVGNVLYYQVTSEVNFIDQLLHALYQMKIQSVLVEGGAKLLQSFIDQGIWDEARIITNTQLQIGQGLPAPDLDNLNLIEEEKLENDYIRYYKH